MIGQRVTRQRRAIGVLMDALDDFRSAQQIHVLLHARGDDMGLATVYRTLGAMAEHGDVDLIRSDSGETLYRRCERKVHHHHLVCRTCGRTVELDGPGVEQMVHGIADASGFVDVVHTVELIGTCAECAAAVRVIAQSAGAGAG